MAARRAAPKSGQSLADQLKDVKVPDPADATAAPAPTPSHRTRHPKIADLATSITGTVGQAIDRVIPGSPKEPPIAPAKADAKGNTAKLLQAALKRIEQLEAKVADIESRPAPTAKLDLSEVDAELRARMRNISDGLRQENSRDRDQLRNELIEQFQQLQHERRTRLEGQIEEIIERMGINAMTEDEIRDLIDEKINDFQREVAAGVKKIFDRELAAQLKPIMDKLNELAAARPIAPAPSPAPKTPRKPVTPKKRKSFWDELDEAF